LILVDFTFLSYLDKTLEGEPSKVLCLQIPRSRVTSSLWKAESPRAT